MHKKTTEDFIRKARAVHGDKYDYSKAVYCGVHAKVCIVCPKHGEFWQEANNHISRKTICPKCARDIIAEKLRISTKQFVEKATKVHGSKYDYSKVSYQGTDKKVCIICPVHGEFWQVPHNHLHGAGCPKCSDNYKPKTEEFIAKVKEIYGNKYDYSKVVYTSNKKKVCVICPEHGEFWTIPQNLLRNHGCPKCSGNYGIDKNLFVKLANERFEGKYDYSRVEWKGYKIKVCIICPDHGEFWQLPFIHLKSLGCPKCSGSYMDQQFFIEKSRMIHGDKYDYSKVVYTDSSNKVCIICPKHGEFWQRPGLHLSGAGCTQCHNERTRIRLTKTAENFVSIANLVHNGKYDYSQMQYVNRSIPIEIICPKHGPFIQIPRNHLSGSGCPMCNSSVLEETVSEILKRHKIRFTPQKTFEWLTYKGTLFLDFYL
ncbi:MAG: hypothetical protein J6129_00940, partial [Bacteroidaceae bacterium]|nr:hypothetical protein [Bacteroidaceae bacterium]